jgi:hypothetical protein
MTGREGSEGSEGSEGGEGSEGSKGSEGRTAAGQIPGRRAQQRACCFCGGSKQGCVCVHDRVSLFVVYKNWIEWKSDVETRAHAHKL